MKTTVTRILIAFVTAIAMAVPQQAQAENQESDPALTETAIEERVIDGLRRTSSIRSQAVLVKSENGIVTLSGQADNLADSRNVSEIAKSTIGVKAVVNQIVVQPPIVDNDALVASATDLMTSLIPADASGVKVEAADGVLKLSGKVNSLAEKKVIESELAFIRGVSEIENKLEIDQRGSMSDAEIKAVIAQLLENSAALDRADIEVEVEGPTVTLSGSVESPRHKLLAINTAEIKGITAVDALALKTELDGEEEKRQQNRYASITDQKIQETVELAWQYHPLLAGVANDLVAVANRGNVVLSGTVPHRASKETAEEVAASVVGVAGIRNRISVSWDNGKRSDDEIVDSVTRAVARDAYLEYSDVLPRSRNAHVHLYGMVDTRFEKERAGKLAAAQPGVVHVANYLTISNADADSTDYEIKEAIDEKLDLMNTVSGVEVTAVVQNGVPVFTGSVSTWFEWQSLLRIAKEAGARKPHLDVNIRFRPQPLGTQLYVPE